MMGATVQAGGTPVRGRGLTPRSLISIGVYTAIYFVVLGGTSAMAAISPAAQVVGYFLGVLINGTVIMLFMVKSPVMWSMTILGAVVGLFMMFMGHFWVTGPLCIVLGFAADLIVRSGGYRSRWRNCVAYAVFELWLVGPFLPVFFNSGPFFDHIESSMGQGYADGMRTLFSPWLTVVFMVLVFVISLISAWIGTRILDRHFARAGIL